MCTPYRRSENFTTVKALQVAFDSLKNKISEQRRGTEKKNYLDFKKPNNSCPLTEIIIVFTTDILSESLAQGT